MSDLDVDLNKVNNIRDLGMITLVFVVFLLALAGAGWRGASAACACSIRRIPIRYCLDAMGWRGACWCYLNRHNSAAA